MGEAYGVPRACAEDQAARRRARRASAYRCLTWSCRLSSYTREVLNRRHALARLFVLPVPPLCLPGRAAWLPLVPGWKSEQAGQQAREVPVPEEPNPGWTIGKRRYPAGCRGCPDRQTIENCRYPAARRGGSPDRETAFERYCRLPCRPRRLRSSFPCSWALRLSGVRIEVIPRSAVQLTARRAGMLKPSQQVTPDVTQEPSVRSRSIRELAPAATLVSAKVPTVSAACRASPGSDSIRQAASLIGRRERLVTSAMCWTRRPGGLTVGSAALETVARRSTASACKRSIASARSSNSLSCASSSSSRFWLILICSLNWRSCSSSLEDWIPSMSAWSLISFACAPGLLT